MVSVVGRIELHVSVVQGATVTALQQFGVNHTGIGLEGDMAGQAVRVNAGDLRALVWDRSFFLDDRSQIHYRWDSRLFVSQLFWAGLNEANFRCPEAEFL